MATTLLQAVNDLLKRVNLIAGDTQELTTLTDDALQTSIDNAVMIYNEVLDDLYTLADVSMPTQLAESSITLQTSQRTATLPSDFVEIIWPLHDETNGKYIYEFPGGLVALKNSQSVTADFTGLPNAAAIDSTTALQIYWDRIPTATENGLVYTLRYHKDLELTAAADTFPCTDAVYRALRPAVVELWKSDNKKEAAGAIFGISMGRAARLLNPNPNSDTYTPNRVRGSNFTDPLIASDPFHAN